MKYAMGLPSREYYFSDGRVYIQAHQESGGYIDLGYHGRQPLEQQSILLGSPFYFMVDGVSCRFEQISIYPFGFENTFLENGKVFNVRMGVENKQIEWIFSGCKEIILSITKESFYQFEQYRGKERILKELTFCESINGVRGSIFGKARYTRPGPGVSIVCLQNPVLPDLFIEGNVYYAIVSLEPLHFQQIDKEYRLTVRKDNSNDHINIAWIFADSEDELKEAVKVFQESPGKSIARQKDRYEKLAAKLPTLKMKDSYLYLPRLFSIIPTYVESMWLPEGTVRAANAGYWYWTWDALQTGFGLLQWGQIGKAKAILQFVNKVKQEDGRLMMNYLHDFHPLQSEVLGLGGDLLVPKLLWTYFSITDDLATVKELYSHSKQIFLGIAEKCNKFGFYPISGIYPDYKEEFGRRSWAFVSLETAWWYDACRCMENLAIILKDEEVEEKADVLIARLRDSFAAAFYNEELGYLNEAVAPETLKPYDVPTLAALLGCFDGPYVEELLWDKISNIASFCEENFLEGGGIRFVPKWEKQGWPEWYGISNNWMTFPDRAIARLFRKAGRGEAIQKMLFLIDSHFAWYGNVFEGRCFERTEPAKIVNSKWLGFSCRSWYGVLLEAGLGIESDYGGLTYIPADISLSMTLENYHFKGGNWKIEVNGKGKWVKEMKIDGERIEGTLKVPLHFLSPGSHRLVVERQTEPPEHPLLLEALDTGVEVISEKNTLKIQVKGYGRSRIKIYSPFLPKIETERGGLILCRWDKKIKVGIVEVDTRKVRVLKVSGKEQKERGDSPE